MPFHQPNPEYLEQQAKEIQARNEARAQRQSGGEDNFLNKIPMGDTVFRFCPPWSSQGITSLRVTKWWVLKDPVQGKAGGWYSLVSPELTYPHANVPDPLYAAFRSLTASGHESILKNIIRQESHIYMNAWIRDVTRTGITRKSPFIVQTPYGVHNQIALWQADRRLGWILDPKNGWDININRSGTGLGTKYMCMLMPSPNGGSGPVVADLAELESLAPLIHDLYQVFPLYSPNPNLGDEKRNKYSRDRYQQLLESANAIGDFCRRMAGSVVATIPGYQVPGATGGPPAGYTPPPGETSYPVQSPPAVQAAHVSYAPAPPAPSYPPTMPAPPVISASEGYGRVQPQVMIPQGRIQPHVMIPQAAPHPLTSHAIPVPPPPSVPTTQAAPVAGPTGNLSAFLGSGIPQMPKPPVPPAPPVSGGVSTMGYQPGGVPSQVAPSSFVQVNRPAEGENSQHPTQGLQSPQTTLNSPVINTPTVLSEGEHRSDPTHNGSRTEMDGQNHREVVTRLNVDQILVQRLPAVQGELFSGDSSEWVDEKVQKAFDPVIKREQIKEIHPNYLLVEFAPGVQKLCSRIQPGYSANSKTGLTRHHNSMQKHGQVNPSDTTIPYVPPATPKPEPELPGLSQPHQPMQIKPPTPSADIGRIPGAPACFFDKNRPTETGFFVISLLPDPAYPPGHQGHAPGVKCRICPFEIPCKESAKRYQPETTSVN
jgi:hypothetical protein